MMKKILMVAMSGLFIISMSCYAMTECDDGFADEFPCNDIDLVAQMKLNQFSLTPAPDNFKGQASDVWGYVDLNTNKEYALMALNVGTVVVDISDPENPTEVGAHKGPVGWHRDIKVYQYFDNNANRWQAYAYVSPSDDHYLDLVIIDLTTLVTSNEQRPITITANYSSVLKAAHNLLIGNIDMSTSVPLAGREPYLVGIAYIDDSVIFGPDAPISFGLFDIANPVAPIRRKAVEIELSFDHQGNPISGIYMHDAVSFVLTDERKEACPNASPAHCEILIGFHPDLNFGFNNFVITWDVTNKSDPQEISRFTYDDAVYAHSGWVTTDKRYLFIHDESDEYSNTTNTTVKIYDISDLTNPVFSTNWVGPTSATEHNGFVVGDRYYISNYSRGLTVLDISEPTNPQEIAFFDTFPAHDLSAAQTTGDSWFNGAWGVYPYLPSGNILVSDGEGGLFILRDEETDDDEDTENGISDGD